jgi:hypothetical protein
VEARLIAAVIASEAKQSISRQTKEVDCFVASLLAMTNGESELFLRQIELP